MQYCIQIRYMVLKTSLAGLFDVFQLYLSNEALSNASSCNNSTKEVVEKKNWFRRKNVFYKKRMMPSKRGFSDIYDEAFCKYKSY